jgi:hypothetical protein
MNIIKEIHGENGAWSSKRVYGGLLIVSVIVLAYLDKEPEILKLMLVMGVSLIGLGTVPAILKAVKAKPDETI